MNSWLPCDKWQHLLGSACIFSLIYFALDRVPLGRWMSTRHHKHLALILALLCAVLWEVGQAILWPLDWPDAGWDLVADCAGIIVMWRIAI